MAHLEIKSRQGLRRVELPDRPLTVGRFHDNDIVLPDDQASRHHCVFEPEGERFRIRDLESRNGTKLNNKRVVKQDDLDNGDVVLIGQTIIRFIDPEQRSKSLRNNTPDFSAADGVPEYMAEATLDIDLNEELIDAQTGYEQKLREIINAASEKPFDENDISLIDNRGNVVHQASSSGLESGGDEEIGESLRVFRMLLLACFRSRATDLHIEPRVEDAAIRLRVDGYMLSAVMLNKALFKRIINMVKILCEIESSQRNQVQDGHFAVIVKGRRVDYRVSFTPAVNGQKLVIRVLDSSNAPSRLHELGLVPWMYEKLRSIATKDAGFLLACGPTGSGKTTSLYSCLREIDVEARNAITIEDPVEYYLEGCTQIPVDHKQGNSFATILRSVLRQDPDVIFLGEIRDIETATVAMQAAMTGHLVYSTVHSKDSIGAIFRLLDLGVESYLVANAVNLIIAQRLVRVLCPACKKPVKPTPSQNLKMGAHLGGVPQIFTPTGCKRCLRTGFVGRQALFELLDVNDNMRDIILKGASITAIRQIAEQGHFVTLQGYGFQLVTQGETSFEEVERVSGSD